MMVTVPFDFMIGQSMFPAGNYVITQTGEQRAIRGPTRGMAGPDAGRLRVLFPWQLLGFNLYVLTTLCKKRPLYIRSSNFPAKTWV